MTPEIWGIILQVFIAVGLALVFAVAHSISTHMKNIHEELKTIREGVEGLAEQHEDPDSPFSTVHVMEHLVEVLKYMRRQLHFERYQRKINKLVTGKLKVSAEDMIDLEAPDELSIGDDGP